MCNMVINKGQKVELIEDDDLKGVNAGKGLTSTKKLGISVGISSGILFVICVTFGVLYGIKKRENNNLKSVNGAIMNDAQVYRYLFGQALNIINRMPQHDNCS